MRHSSTPLLTAIPLALAAFGLGAAAQAQTASVSPEPTTMSRSAQADASDAQDRVNNAVKVVNEMQQDTHLAHLLERARGVFVIPHFAKGALIVGGEGGGGVVLARHAARWSDPAFFVVSGASIGAQAGGSGGAVAMLLMTPRALEKFESSTSKWSLSAGAGLTVVRYSGNVRARTVPRGDVIVWSDQEGLYGGLAASATDVMPEAKLDHAYYQKHVSPRQILTGEARNSNAAPLRDALIMRVASK
ncbi:MAG: lipid-binding SYLF domain-containing protein [Steroidobacteraceae bacterium]